MPATVVVIEFELNNLSPPTCLGYETRLRENIAIEELFDRLLIVTVS